MSCLLCNKQNVVFLHTWATGPFIVLFALFQSAKKKQQFFGVKHRSSSSEEPQTKKSGEPARWHCVVTAIPTTPGGSLLSGALSASQWPKSATAEVARASALYLPIGARDVHRR